MVLEAFFLLEEAVKCSTALGLVSLLRQGRGRWRSISDSYCPMKLTPEVGVVAKGIKRADIPVL